MHVLNYFCIIIDKPSIHRHSDTGVDTHTEYVLGLLTKPSTPQVYSVQMILIRQMVTYSQISALTLEY